jgi:hypothetical protein
VTYVTFLRLQSCVVEKLLADAESYHDEILAAGRGGLFFSALNARSWLQRLLPDP